MYTNIYIFILYLSIYLSYMYKRTVTIKLNLQSLCLFYRDTKHIFDVK